MSPRAAKPPGGTIFALPAHDLQQTAVRCHMIEHFVAFLEEGPEQVLQRNQFGAALGVDRHLLNFTLWAEFKAFGM